MRTAVILATGPSLTEEVLHAARIGQEELGWKIYAMNHAWRVFPSADAFHACNYQYYDAEWENGLKDLTCQKTTIDMQTARKYNIRYIAGRWGDGFSQDQSYIHYGHGSGFQTPQIAYHDGFKRILLCGYDMAYARDYNGRNKRVGSTPRHFFGEYDHPMLNHWPSKRVVNGVHEELIEQFEKVKLLNPDCEIVNCSEGSAMECFPFGKLDDFLEDTKKPVRKKRVGMAGRRPKADTGN